MNILVEKIDIVRSEIYKINKALEDKRIAKEEEKAIAVSVENAVGVDTE